MIRNPVIETLLNRKSIRQFTAEMPSDEIIETIVRAGQQAPFAAQIYSVLLSRQQPIVFDAPLLFTICVDVHKFRLIMTKRNWPLVTNPLSLLIYGMQDASLMAENMVIAAESLGLGSCFLGAWPYYANELAAEYNLPELVFPMVGLVVGYPAENPPPRPRYPLEYTLFENCYPQLTDEMVEKAMQVMDEGYLAQDYYRNLKAMIALEEGQQDQFTYDNYSWTEHISRKWGQWHKDQRAIMRQLAQRGFTIVGQEQADN